MSSEKPESYEDAVPFEQAFDRTGFGVYNFSHTLLTGLTIIAFSCVSYSSSVLVPSSACELETTVAEQGLLASMPLVGSILGAFIWGFLGDTRGRQRMLLLSLMLSIFLNTLGSISVNWSMLVVFQFFTSLAASGQYTLSMTLLSECVPLARRNLMMLLVSSIFMLSQGIMAVLAIPVIPLSFSYYLPTLDIYWNSWRTVMVMYSVPSIVCFTWYLFIEESPKFLFMKGEEEKALEVLRVIHRKNTWKSTGEFQIKKLLADESSSTKQKRSIKEQFMPLFKPPLLKNTVIMVTLMVQQQVGAFKVWLPTIANQVIQTLQAGSGSDLSVCGILNLRADLEPDPDRAPCSLNETALLMVLTVAAFISVINLLITTVVDRTGRRNMAIIVTSIIGSAGILVNLVPNAIGSSILFMVFLMGIIVYGLYTAISVALFPTEVRVMAVSLGMAAGRLATFANIQILNLMFRNNCAMAFYIFGAIFASSALVASLLPDDRKKMANKDDEEKTTEL